MSIIGSSSVAQVGAFTIINGGTGPTGPTGNTGPAGIGLTGNTGYGIAGITLVNRYVVTTFTDGTSYSTPLQVYGATGSVNYLIDYSNIGTGITIGHSINSSGDLVVRPITFVNNTDGRLVIQSDPNKININLQPSVSSGITLQSITDTSSFLLKFKNKKLSRIGNAKGVTGLDGSDIGLRFINANIFERVRGMGWTGSTGAVYCQQTANGITCTLNPFVAEYDGLMYGLKSRIFVGDFNGSTGSLVVAPVPNDGNAYGIEIHLKNCKNPSLLNNRFISNSSIYWPLNKPPCFSIDGVTCDIRVTMFGINNKWYATAKSTTEFCSGNTLFYSNCSSIPPSSQYIGYNEQILGACCKSDGTCEQTIPSLCSGYFNGFGTTCGNTYDSICNKPGACCFSGKDSTSTKDTQTNKFTSLEFCSEITCFECINYNSAETLYKTRFAGVGTKCSDTKCNNVIVDKGACCNGKGLCLELTKEECSNISGFYQGNASKCLAFGKSICFTGTGPCCVNGNCNQQNATDCFAANGYFLGTGRTCSDIECPNNISCLGIIDGIKIYPGQKYGGGYVVGTYQPGTTEILGAKDLFSPTGVLGISGITIYNSTSYKSFMDHSAYGITKENCTNTEGYIIIVYPNDVYENDKVYNTFSWGGTGSSWGPILDNSGNINEFKLYSGTDITVPIINYLDSHIKYNEGYWGITASDTISDNLILQSFPTCNSTLLYGNKGDQRIFAKSPHSLHGSWSQSWGIYNTIRAISAYNTNKRSVGLSGYFYYTNFSGITTSTAFIAARSVSDGITSSTQGITGNTKAMSGWYLPSHDEMAFIAASTKSYVSNINTELLLDGAEPIDGIYWTSTGTFDYTKNEGIYNSNKPNPGSMAISMKIDVNQNNYKVYKSNRSEKYKVRPIRMIRCDSLVPANRYLWLIPSVYSKTPIANQRNIDTTNIGVS